MARPEAGGQLSDYALIEVRFAKRAMRWRVAGYQRRDRPGELHCEGDVTTNSCRQGQLTGSAK